MAIGTTPLLLPFAGVDPVFRGPIALCGRRSAVLGRATVGGGLALGAFATIRADGETVTAGDRFFLGECSTVHIAHGGGLVTLYAHLGNLVPAVAEGRRQVAAGEALGHVARTGVTYGTHLFFAVLRGTEAIDPEPLLGVPRCGR